MTIVLKQWTINVQPDDDEVMTSGTPQEGEIGSFVCACVVVFVRCVSGNTCGDLTHLRLLHTQMF